MHLVVQVGCPRYWCWRRDKFRPCLLYRIKGNWKTPRIKQNSSCVCPSLQFANKQHLNLLLRRFIFQNILSLFTGTLTNTMRIIHFQLGTHNTLGSLLYLLKNKVQQQSSITQSRGCIIYTCTLTNDYKFISTSAYTTLLCAMIVVVR